MKMLVLAAAILATALAPLAPAVGEVSTSGVRVRSLVYPFSEGAVFAMPGEKIPLAVDALRTRLHSVEAPQGALTALSPNRWTWQAPPRPGAYELKVKNTAGSTLAKLSAFVMVPSTRAREGILNGYQIGVYPPKPLHGNPIYTPPRGFIEVTRELEDAKVSPNFRIRQFLTKQKSGFPKYLVLDEGLIVLLEAIGQQLEPKGWDADDIFVMSGYRTPYYNQQLDDTKFSLHQWGRAADIFLDKDGNGVMDDFNGDKRSTRDDAVAFATFLESLANRPEFGALIGGVGVYGATASHGPFVHVDTRPWRARW